MSLPVSLLCPAGAGMFIGCVVAGSVMLVSDGAKVRGALIRDVSTYLLAVVTVAAMMHSGKVSGRWLSHMHLMRTPGVCPFHDHGSHNATFMGFVDQIDKPSKVCWLACAQIGRWDVAILLGVYVLFVFVVFAADLYHRLQSSLQ